MLRNRIDWRHKTKDLSHVQHWLILLCVNKSGVDCAAFILNMKSIMFFSNADFSMFIYQFQIIFIVYFLIFYILS